MWGRDPKQMKIASAASAFPKHYYPQKFLMEKLQQYWADRLRILRCWSDCIVT